jgi:DNA polymerase sigma
MIEDFVSFHKEAEVAKEEDFEEYEDAALLTDVLAPWLRTALPHNAPPLLRLHNEILSFCEHITPSRAQMKVRASIVKELTEIVNELWPSATVHVFGSQLTKILTPSSDVDITVLNIPPPAKGAEHDLNKLLLDLASKITTKGICSYVEVIPAKVPIIKLDHIISGLSVDVCCMEASGLQTGALVKKMVTDYPPMRPLTILIKQFLAQRRLNETYHGGIGSFVLCMMVVSFLQHRQRVEQNMDLHLSWNLGSLLIDFLTLYSGGSFDFTNTAISVAHGGRYFDKTSIPEWRPSTMLSIENPHLAGVDMGKNSFLLPKIRRSFEHALQLLSFALSDGAAASYLGFFIRTDDPALHQEVTTDLNEKGALLGSDSSSSSSSSSDDDSDCIVLGTSSAGNSSSNGKSNSNTTPSKSGSQATLSAPVTAFKTRTTAPMMDGHALLDIGGDPYDEASSEESDDEDSEDSEGEEEESEEEELDDDDSSEINSFNEKELGFDGESSKKKRNRNSSNERKGERIATKKKNKGDFPGHKKPHSVGSFDDGDEYGASTKGSKSSGKSSPISPHYFHSHATTSSSSKKRKLSPSSSPRTNPSHAPSTTDSHSKKKQKQKRYEKNESESAMTRKREKKTKVKEEKRRQRRQQKGSKKEQNCIKLE